MCVIIGSGSLCQTLNGAWVNHRAVNLMKSVEINAWILSNDPAIKNKILLCIRCMILVFFGLIILWYFSGLFDVGVIVPAPVVICALYSVYLLNNILMFVIPPNLIMYDVNVHILEISVSLSLMSLFFHLSESWYIIVYLVVLTEFYSSLYQLSYLYGTVILISFDALVTICMFFEFIYFEHDFAQNIWLIFVHSLCHLFITFTKNMIVMRRFSVYSDIVQFKVINKDALNELDNYSHKSENERVTLLFGSCINQRIPYIPTLELMANYKRITDLIVLCGDNIYADHINCPCFDSIDSLDHNKEYNRLLNNKSFAKLLNASKQYDTHMIASWDDHDFGMNGADGNYKHKIQSKKEFVSFLNQINADKQLNQYKNEIMHNDARGIWYHYDLKKDNIFMRFYVLDGMYERRLMDEREFETFSKTQYQWLESLIADNNEIALVDWHLFVVGTTFLTQPKINIPPVSQCNVETKHKLMSLLKRANIAEKSIFLSGDLHVSFNLHYHGVTELISSSLTHSVKIPCLQYIPCWQANKFADAQSKIIGVNNFGFIQFTKDAWHTSFKDAYGFSYLFENNELNPPKQKASPFSFLSTEVATLVVVTYRLGWNIYYFLTVEQSYLWYGHVIETVLCVGALWLHTTRFYRHAPLIVKHSIEAKKWTVLFAFNAIVVIIWNLLQQHFNIFNGFTYAFLLYLVFSVVVVGMSQIVSYTIFSAKLKSDRIRIEWVTWWIDIPLIVLNATMSTFLLVEHDIWVNIWIADLVYHIFELFYVWLREGCLLSVVSNETETEHETGGDTEEQINLLFSQSDRE